MKGIRRIFRLSLLRPADVARDVDEELATHLALREARLRAEGLAPDEAARVARERFGDVAHIRDEVLRADHGEVRVARAARWLEETVTDARLALRSLSHAKAFTLAVVLTLALGIGANATMFAITEAVVLRPIGGVPNAGRIHEMREVLSVPAFIELQRRLADVRVAVIRERRIALGTEAAEPGMAGFVSGGFFAVTGVRTVLGRPLVESDDVDGAPAVGVLSHEYWTRAFGADRGVLGRTVPVGGIAVTIVGVAAPEFRGLHLGATPAVWMPLHAWLLMRPGARTREEFESPNHSWLRMIALLPPGASPARAEAAIVAARRVVQPELVPRRRKELVDGNRESELLEGSRLRPLQAAALPPGARDGVIVFVALLSGVVALVLLSACANITSLLMARAASREREIAVRVALGAGKGRLVRQLLTEALVLAALGGLAGAAVFLAVRRVLAGLTLPGGVSGSTIALEASPRLVALAVLLTLGAGLLVGLAPALQSSRLDAGAAMKGAGLGLGRRRQRLRGALVTAQVTVGLVLLVGTGLFTRALGRAFSIETGLDTEHLVMLGADPSLAGLSPERSLAYYDAAARNAARVPGVRDVTWSAAIPLSNDRDRSNAEVEGYAVPAGERLFLEFGWVGPRYHETTGIPIVAGRGLTERDDLAAPKVAIVNEALARKFFGNRSPVGAHIDLEGGPREIVGVAKDVAIHEVGERPQPYVYLPLTQTPPGEHRLAGMLVRTSGDAASVLRGVVQAVRATDGSVPVFASATMRQRLRDVFAPQLAGAWLLGVFSLLALAVAAVGIYGIVAYAVSQRTREIGIRMALGARGASVVRLIVGANLRWVAIGIPLGLALAVAAGRTLGAFLYGVSAFDAPTLAGTVGVMVVVAGVAAWMPARRAVRVDPVAALRSDG